MKSSVLYDKQAKYELTDEGPLHVGEPMSLNNSYSN